MQITVSRVRRHPDVVRIILQYFPTLDPFAIVCNSDLYLISENGRTISFATRKKYGGARELGTVYTDPAYRGQGHAGKIIQAIAGLEPCLFVLCEEELAPFYEKLGFVRPKTEHPVITLRRIAFNIFLKPIFGYRLVSLRATHGSPRSYCT